jgi:molybdopterin-binding protein
MSKIVATISNISSVENLNIVKFDFNNTQLTMMSLDLQKSLKIGSKVLLGIKPTHLALAKNFTGELSFSNQFDTQIISITNGELLSNIKLKTNDTILESIITVESTKRMQQEVGQNILAIVKASDLSILEILDA